MPVNNIQEKHTNRTFLWTGDDVQPLEPYIQFKNKCRLFSLRPHGWWVNTVGFLLTNRGVSDNQRYCIFKFWPLSQGSGSLKLKTERAERFECLESRKGHGPAHPFFSTGGKNIFHGRKKNFPREEPYLSCSWSGKSFSSFSCQFSGDGNTKALYSRNSPPNPVKGAAERMNESQKRVQHGAVHRRAVPSWLKISDLRSSCIAE